VNKCIIQAFYTTFLVLFYVLIPQKVTAKDLREKHAKNHAENGHKNEQKCSMRIRKYCQTMRLSLLNVCPAASG
jgi:hypothetical protein